MPPRKRPSFARRHEVTLELRCVLANMGATRWYRIDDPELSADAVRRSWENYWGSATEGWAAFAALRDRPALHVEDKQSYETWLASFLEPDPRRADDEPADAGDAQAPDNEED